MSSSEGYDPNRSRVSASSMEAWLQGNLEEDLTTVPGIGPAAKEKLEADGITNVGQLLAKYMSYTCYDGEGDERYLDVFAMNQVFWHYLQEIKISSMRSGIVQAVNKKVAIGFTAYADDESNY